jgi:4-hydroxy-3-polyprenylbenzoate decarboxylase
MDLRDYISLCEKEGELKRIKAEVDWDLEMSHIAKINEENSGPALLFENLKAIRFRCCPARAQRPQACPYHGRSETSSMVDLMREWGREDRKQDTSTVCRKSSV